MSCSCHLSYDQKNAGDAIKSLKNALSAYKTIDDTRQLVRLYYKLSYMYIGIGRSDVADKYAELSLNIAKTVDNPAALGHAYWAKGNVLASYGLATEALRWFEKALEIFMVLNDMIAANIIRREIGVLYKFKGEFKNAIIYLEGSLKFFDRLKFMNKISFINYELGDVYLQMGQLDDAEQYHIVSLDKAQITSNYWIEGAALSGIAQVWARRGDTEAALNWYKEAMLCADKIGGIRKRANIFYGIGEIHIQNNNLILALEYMRRAIINKDDSIGRRETLFAVAYSLINYNSLSANEVANSVNVILDDSRERALLLVIIASLMKSKKPEITIIAGELLREIKHPLHQLSSLKNIRLFNKQLKGFNTVGDLLAAIIQKNVVFSKNESALIERILVDEGYWPDDINLDSIAYYSNMHYWGGGGGCFPPGTLLLLSDGKSCSIERLKLGQSVVSPVLEGEEWVDGVVEAIHFGESTHYYLINQAIRITATHPVLTKDKWLSVSELCVGDELYDQQLRVVKVQEIEIVNEKTWVYNIHLNRGHTFFAEGILVHNAEYDGSKAGG